MSSADPLAESARGYLSLESKRRFTLVAGILGAVFFVAQFVLPMLVMFLVMMPMMVGAISTADLDQIALWRNELWFVERTAKLNWRDVDKSTRSANLRHVRLAGLENAGPLVPLPDGANEETATLLPVGDRLWFVGVGEVGYYENGAVTRLSGAGRPARASRPFVHQGRLSVVTHGKNPTLATLDTEDGRATWTTREFPLGLPPESGSLRSLQATEAAGRLYLFAELCTEEPEQCSLRYREPEHENWLPLAEDACSCATWDAIVLGARPAVVLSERAKDGTSQVAVVTVTENGAQRQPIELEGKRSTWSRWRALSLEDRLLLVSQRLPDGLTLAEVRDGKVVRSVGKSRSFPFAPGMMFFMAIPQLLPIALSLALALFLTGQMRRHRVADYVLEGSRKRFASLWQRALAQLVDAVPLAAGFVLPIAWMWRMFSDPEDIVENRPTFMLWFLGLFAAAFVCALLVLVVYSYFEGRYGKTPGKWLLGIRVLGTDLRPCGFGRALLRNLLTLVDGFFNFLVGVLLVALTENWQRLGDLAARTIVVVDDKPA